MMRNGIVAFADFREGGLQGIDQIKEATSGLSIKSIVLGRPDTTMIYREIFTKIENFHLT